MRSLIQLLPLLAIFAVFWFLLVLPARRRAKTAAAMQSQLAVGDQVVTTGGIYGAIAQVTDDRIGLEVAPGVVIELARGALVGKIEPSTREA